MGPSYMSRRIEISEDKVFRRARHREIRVRQTRGLRMTRFALRYVAKLAEAEGMFVMPEGYCDSGGHQCG